MIYVRQSLQEVKKVCLTLKEPKSGKSRSITITSFLAKELKKIYKQQLVYKLLLGQVFNEENFYGRDPQLKSDQEVIESFTYLNNLYNWDLLTVSLSPEHCGGEEACNHLFQLFLNVFELDLKKGISWDK
ncbi:hypothetical protein [Metabacillus sp. FJAT-53654]|uniref:Uncharacterized protein n=1 Tax=Metabacillus rhizosphaerae TaxID=3117747 RepID=A0ABZ2MNV3_9BACI